MKYNILKITFLLLVAIFNATIGIGSLPLWAYILIEFISIILLVYVSVRMFSDNNLVIDQELKKLTETITTISEQSKAQWENNTSKLLNSLSNNQDQVLQQLTLSEETLSKNIESSTSQINEKVSHTYDLVQKEFTKQTDLVGALQQNTIEMFNGLSKDIISLNESSRKQAIENANELKRTLASNTEHLSAVVNDSFKTIQESTFSSSEQLKQQIAQICDTIQESINTSASDLVAKTDALTETLKTTNDEIQAKVEGASNGMSQLISEGIGAITTSVSTGIDGARQASSEFAEQIMSANKENSASILQKVEDVIQHSIAIQESITTSAADLAAKTDTLNETIKTTNDEIQTKVEGASNGMSQLISEGIGAITTSVSTVIDGARQASSESAEQIMSANKENSVSILQKVEDVMQHSIAIQESITTSATDLAAKADTLNETIKTTNDEIQAKVESASNGMSQLISESIGAITTSVSTGIDGARQASSESAEQIMSANKENSASILQKVDELILQGATIEKQNNTISSLIVDSVKESDKATEMFMSGLQDQYQTINKGLTSVQLKTENIENSVLHISEKEFNKKIVDSIQSLILELRTDIKNSISDINNEILDTQIAQETINSELEKLQVLLRTVLNSFENKTEKIVKQVATESNKQVKPSSSTSSILPNVSRSVEQNVKSHQPAPNRTESIVDSETKNIVVNQYKDGDVVKSTMKDSKGHTIYEVEYSKGKIVRTRNYDNKGKLTIEQTFYDNGQVHYRNEYTSKGKVTTEFDINGKKE